MKLCHTSIEFYSKILVIIDVCLSIFMFACIEARSLAANGQVKHGSSLVIGWLVGFEGNWPGGHFVTKYIVALNQWGHNGEKCLLFCWIHATSKSISRLISQVMACTAFGSLDDFHLSLSMHDHSIKQGFIYEKPKIQI